MVSNPEFLKMLLIRDETNKAYTMTEFLDKIEKLKISLERKGLTIIPLSLYLKGSWIKLKIGVGKGRKIHDKRDREKINDSKRDVANALKRF